MKILHASAEIDERSINEDERTAEFVVSTERVVETWNGREVLRMDGVNLKRFTKNPVVLDSHNRFETTAVIGRAEVRVDGKKLRAKITYAETQRAQDVWDLVRGGFVKATSIGYMIDRASAVRLGEGEVDGDVKGPALIARKWTLLEISNVPIPADEDAVRRDFFESLPQENDDVDKRSGINYGAAVGGSAAEGTTPVQPAAPNNQPTQPILRMVDPAVEQLESKRRMVNAITPRGLESVADDGLVRGETFEQIQKRLIDAQAARFKPVGTTEPVEPKTEKDAESQRAEKTLPDHVTDEVLVRSFGNLS